MENMFNDKEKIEIFKQIQYDLIDLKSNSSEDDLNNLISRIPQDILNNKDNLMILCQVFAKYARNNRHSIKGNALRLFEKIIEPMKTHLQDESSFFWDILGGLYIFKLYMYEEGLISIEKIIFSTRQLVFSKSTEFFLPEIIEREPEIFEKEIKTHLEPNKYSKEYISEFKELRRKYLNWLRNSNDFNDPSYREIERDPLRLSIKTDDIDTFQTILSNTNTDINSIIEESVLENFTKKNLKQSLISCAINYNSINILKYLVMRDASLAQSDVFRSICEKNYDVIHIVESRIKNHFEKCSFISAIICWNEEIIEYSTTNYPLKYLTENEFDEDDLADIKDMFMTTFAASNFIFLDNYLIPFLRRNPEFLKEKIYQIINFTYSDYSCFFLREFLKYPGIDINYYSGHLQCGKTLLLDALVERNGRAVEILFQNPSIDINSFGNQNFTPFQIACGMNFDMKIIKLFCNHPDNDINLMDRLERINAVQLCATKGNSYALDFLIENYYNDLNFGDINEIYRFCIKHNLLVNLKIVLKYNLKSSTRSKIIDDFKNSLGNSLKRESLNTMIKILNEIE